MRLYLDWTADSEDKMLSLALSNSNGTSNEKFDSHFA